MRAAARVAEEHVEDIAEGARAEPGVVAARTVADETEAIVLRALVRIREHFVRFVDLFEAVLGLGLVVRNVGMVLARERAVSALDILAGGAASDAEHLVVIAGRHPTRPAPALRPRNGG